MAYAALVSLSQTIHKLLHDQDQYPAISPHEKQQIISMHERIILFQAFLEDYSEKASSLEGRIMDAANEAEDMIEYFMWKQIDQRRNFTTESTAGPESTTELSDPNGMLFDFNNFMDVVKSFMSEEIDEPQNYTSDSTAGPESTTEISDPNDMFDFENFVGSEEIDEPQNYTSNSTAGPESTTELSDPNDMFDFENFVGVVKSFMSEEIDGPQNYTSVSTVGPESTSEVSHPSDMFDFENLNRVTEEIESIAGEVREIKNSTRAKVKLCDSSAAATSSSRLIIASTSCKLDTAMVGFEDQLMAMKDRLCGESSKLQVIPIFGMGGIGKTTLAKNVYDDQLTVEHFQIRAWVTVSQDYNAPQILSSLLASVQPRRSEESDESKMAHNVYKSLKGRRYLIVMDDMWTTKAWDDVRRIFPDDHNSSRIILTTRLSHVAAYPDSCSPIHEMPFMDLYQSWNLLRKKVFPGGNCPPQLEDIGKTIARSCRGLPLAIIVIAGLLSTVSPTRASWENIARNVNEAVTTNDEQFAEIVLSLSYNQLPHHLRPCFLYMGAFPEDYEIRVSKLTKLWVAEGFLKLSNGYKSWEEVAEEYLEDLIKRSLIFVLRRKSNGKIKSCIVHDLVRDLCIRKAQQEKFLVCVQESIRNQRRVGVSRSIDLICLEPIFDLRIHTIICIKFTEKKWDCLRNIRLLRVFDVVDIIPDFYNFLPPPLPPQIIKLFHLRYLTLPHEVEIPADISILENLQTLIIYNEGVPWETTMLPFEVFRMRQLRHLVTSNSFHLPDPKGADFALENLQTLSQVRNLVCTREILQMIPNLKKLGISYFPGQYVGNIELENLVHLHQLEKLTLNILGNVPSFCEMVKPLFPTSLKPVFPTSLKKLTLDGILRSWEDMGIIGSLPNLEVLKLRKHACTGKKWETREGEFRKLKYLLIDKSDLEEWITESSHFPSLKCLVLFIKHLDEIPDGIGEIPTLELIEVTDRNEFLMISAKRIQEEQQENWGNDALQVRCVPWLNWGRTISSSRC